ncbi:hypothetical protein GUITHDRAFT_165694 [Guillardia theta CCMP2712]|uniref:Uncharacterized protein n=1 Tax=Guillardia theta (strain CCMP2712) TaxID=905079 RepID=L1IKW8_GUITC|nr:hypothetical protein GUITHDRAFT_165694 [Guillardia theta CCMP2712]EKX36564.1 hypothetical protein GUITHDRAFT_165694 [Guillardia theta CCMP2712]|eukprot:XP_005823544.1 hypothetical protein GUITHDRAFT_165694 [Guillardia theta CCMP2712]
MRLSSCNLAFLSLGVVLLFDVLCEGYVNVAHHAALSGVGRAQIKKSVASKRPRSSSVRNVFLPPGGIPPVDDDFEESPKKQRSPASPGLIRPGACPVSLPPCRSEAGRRQSEWDDRNSPIRDYHPVTGSNLASPDELNELLRPTGLDRHRLKLHPDEAFGAIFRFEGVLSDTLPIHKSAWTKVAEEMNLRIPEENDVKMAMTMPAEKAIQRVMYWTQDWGDTKRIAFRKAELFFECWQQYDHACLEETKEWLEKLYKASIPICVCSEMDVNSLNVSLTKMGISQYSIAMVTAEDDCDTRAQMYLSAALKLNRPPQFCVIFDDDPESISSAHDISAQFLADTRDGS